MNQAERPAASIAAPILEPSGLITSTPSRWAATRPDGQCGQIPAGQQRGEVSKDKLGG